MPTDAVDTPQPAPEATPAPGPSPERRGLRLGFGIATMFSLGAGLAWPVWTIGAVFSNLLLQGAGPMPPKAAKGVLALSALSMLAVWYLAQILIAYPVFFLAGLILSIFGVFRYAAKGGELLIVVLLMVAILVVPTLLLTSPQLALIVATWLFLNIAFAIALSWVFFTLIPVDAAAPPKAAKAAVSDSEATRHALRMTVVTAPYAIVHFALGWTNILPLIFIAILSIFLSTAEGSKMGKGLLIANVLGGVVAIAAYEVLVMAPFYPLMVALIVMLAMVGARTLVSGGKLAPLAGPSLNGFIVLLGGTLAPLGDDAQTALTDRLISIGGAVLYVTIAHAIVSGLKSERDSAEPPAPAEGPEAPPVEV